MSLGACAVKITQTQTSVKYMTQSLMCGVALQLHCVQFFQEKNTVSVVSFRGKIFVCHVFDQDDPQQNVPLQVYDTVTSEWKTCTNICQRSENQITISRLRMPRRVLDMCKVLS